MIVHCNFEELTALKTGVRQILDGYAPEPGVVAAPPEERDKVASLLPHLSGDLSMETLAEQKALRSAVKAPRSRSRPLPWGHTAPVR